MPSGATWRNLVFYWAATFFIALLTMAYGSFGPEQMIVDAIIVWFPPALIALALRKQKTARRRYLGPLVWLTIMIVLMSIGRGTIPI
jgi:hypothetical protein